MPITNINQLDPNKVKNTLNTINPVTGVNYTQEDVLSSLKKNNVSLTPTRPTIPVPNPPVDTSNFTTKGVKGINETQVKIPAVNMIKIPGKDNIKATTVDTSKPTNTGIVNIEPTPKIEPYNYDKSTGLTTTNTGISNIGGTTSNDGLINTGIPVLDQQLNKLKGQQNTTIDETIKNYNLNRAELEKNKGYFTNFSDIDSKVNSIFTDIGAIQKSTGGVISEADYQNIANKYGVDVNTIKNPVNLYKGLKLTQEGESQFGVNKYNQGIDDLTTQFDRNKQDIQTSLDNSLNQINQQITDVETQLKRNIDYMTASGVWSGGIKSSGYQLGMQNVKDDGKKTIDRLKELYNRVETASEEDLSRVTQDYNTALTRAKEGFDKQMNDILQESGIRLNGIEYEYGVGSEKLTNALNEINDKFASQSFDVYSKYLSNMQSIDNLINTRIDKAQEQELFNMEKSDLRYNEYLTNQGLLENSSLNGLMQEYKSGNLTQKRLIDLKNIMSSSIIDTLNTVGFVKEADINTINTLLSQGKTPNEILSYFRQMDDFKGAGKEFGIVDKVEGPNFTRVYFNDGTYEDISQVDNSVASTGSSSNVSGGGSFSGTNLEARTNRHNNPTAFTIDIAKQGGLVEGIDYVKGDPFPNNPNLFTAKLLGNGIEQTKKVIDNIGFYTQSGQPRRTYLKEIFGENNANDVWEVMNDEEKDLIISEMYKRETDNQYENFAGFTGSNARELTAVDKKTLSSFKGNDIEGLAEDLGVSIAEAKQMYNQYSMSEVDSGEGLTSQDEIKINKILFQVSGKQVGPEERKIYYDMYKDLKSDGLTDKQIGQELTGYYLYDENKGNKEKETILKGLSKYAFGNSDINIPQNVAQNINYDNYLGAITEIDNGKFSSVKGLEDPANEIESMLKVYNRMNTSIKKYESSFGPISGWTTKKWNKYMGDNPEFSGLLSDMATFVAGYRNKISGTAVTKSESKFLEDVIPTINNSPTTVYGKLTALKKKMVEEYNAKRKQVGLPQLFDDQILDFEKKLKAYVGGEYKTPIDVTKSNTLGSLGVGLSTAIGTGRGATASTYTEDDLRKMYETGNFGDGNSTPINKYTPEEEALLNNY